MLRERKRAPAGVHALMLACSIGLLGCAALPWPGPKLPIAAAPGPRGLLDLRGVVHVHTDISQDARGRLEDAVRAAHRAGVQWIAFNEHRRGEGEPFAAWPERMDDVTLIPGWEMGSDGGSILFLGVSKRPPRFETAQQASRWAHARGGLAYIGHMEKSGLVDPARFEDADLDGLEIINLHAQAKQYRWSFSSGVLLLPAPCALRRLLRIPEPHLASLDSLPDAPGIVGGVDAHAKLRVLGRWTTLDRYTDLFRSVTTHVLSSSTRAADVVDALRAGRSYVALEGLAPVPHFDFVRRGGAFEVDAPRPARIRLVCDGRDAGSAEGAHVTLVLPPGARRCRLQAELDGRLWIATAPQRVAAEGSSRIGALHDP